MLAKRMLNVFKAQKHDELILCAVKTFVKNEQFTKEGVKQLETQIKIKIDQAKKEAVVDNLNISTRPEATPFPATYASSSLSPAVAPKRNT